MIDPQKLAHKAEQFAREMGGSPELQRHLQEHKRRVGRAQALLTPERIPTLGESELRELFFDSDSFNFWQKKEWQFNKRLQRYGVAGLRQALAELMSRAEQGLTPEGLQQIWEMQGLGRLLTTELLAYRFPSRYWTYSPNVTLPALEALGDRVKEEMPRGQKSDAYLYFALEPRMAAIRQALANCSLADSDCLLADIFLIWVKETAEEPAPVPPPDGTGPSIWLFQANPKLYDLASELENVAAGDRDSWIVSRYREGMKAGDTVLLWQGGKEAGVYAVAKLVGPPYKRDSPPEAQELEQRPYLKNEWCVDLQYTDLLQEPVLRERLTNHPVLRNLGVLRFAQATNYRVTAEEWAALQELIRSGDLPPRESESFARSVVESLYADPQVRTECLKWFANSIACAHRAGAGIWAVSLFQDRVRLNVGKIEVAVLRRDEVYLVLDEASLMDPARSELEKAGGALPSSASYAAVPGSRGCTLPAADAFRLLEVLSEPHETLIRKAARTVAHRTPYYRSHSPGLISYLRSVLTTDVPEPGHDEQRPPQDVGPSLFRAFPAAGLAFTRWQIATFYTALQVKGFVILSGISGTGKSKLAQHFARFLAQPPSGRKSKDRAPQPQNWLFVPVRPDWRDSKSLLGYFNPLARTYEWTPLLRFLLRAVDSYRSDNPEPFFVILDEMNLAHVEHYFAEFLSVVESGRDDEGWTREALCFEVPDDAKGDLPPRNLFLPPNLYAVGTVNVDETTRAFSPKVLDRAFTIELTEADFTDYPPAPVARAQPTPEERDALLRDFTFDGDFTFWEKSVVAEYVAEHPEVRTRLSNLNGLLRPHDLHFGYRVFDEIILFLDAADRNQLFTGLGDSQTALDAAVLMKVLPKFHGSRGKLEAPLCGVLAWCINPEAPAEAAVADALKEVETTEDLSEQLGQLTYTCPETARRATRMMRLLYTDGFAAFS